MEGMKKIKSTSFHQYSWYSEVETTWISLIGWHHKTSTACVLYWEPRIWVNMIKSCLTKPESHLHTMGYLFSIVPIFSCNFKYYDRGNKVPKVSFTHRYTRLNNHTSKFLSSLFPLIFLSKLIRLYALVRPKWVLEIIWPLNQHFKLKNQRNWLRTSNVKFLEWDYV